MEGSYALHSTDLNVPKPTFTCPDLNSFCLLDQLELIIAGQQDHPDKAIL